MLSNLAFWLLISTFSYFKLFLATSTLHITVLLLFCSLRMFRILGISVLICYPFLLVIWYFLVFLLGTVFPFLGGGISSFSYYHFLWFWRGLKSTVWWKDFGLAIISPAAMFPLQFTIQAGSSLLYYDSSHCTEFTRTVGNSYMLMSNYFRIDLYFQVS